MSVFTKSRWLKRLGIGALALIGLGAVALAPAPASARVFVELGVPTYYPYIYPGYYGPAHYGYPYRSGVFIGFGGHHHHHDWRH